MTTEIINIGSLVNVRNQPQVLRGSGLAELPCIKDAYLLIEDGIISEFGKNNNREPVTENPIDAGEGMVLPAWCDSHTHLVFAAS